MQKLLRVAQHARYHAIATNKKTPIQKYMQLVSGIMDARSAYKESSAKVFCNLCSWSGRHFVDFHVGYDFVFKKSLCPECFSHPRHRSYRYTMDRILNEFQQDRIKVLHFAPEHIIAELLLDNPKVDYLSVDIDHRQAMRKEDIKQLSFKDNQFDLIVCMHVLEHIDDDKKAMQELFRVLKPGGKALLDVPIDTERSDTYEDSSITSPEARTKAFWQWDHVRLYGLDFADKLRSIGFDVIEDNHIQNKGKELIQQQGLEDTVNYIGIKRSDTNLL
jgi:hypothetical protein